jgi:cyclopropane-fatty-acyl-phospholipid synthase
MSATFDSARARPAANEHADVGVRILANLLRDLRGGAGFRVWDNVEHRVGSQSPAFTFVVRDPAVLRQLVIKRSPLLLADAYFRGLVDFEGDLYAALGLKQHFKSLALSLRESAALLLDALRLPSRSPPAAAADALHGGRPFRHRHSRDSDREAIAFHYDASNDFYRLWLDEQMVYSCAVFESPSDTLEQAQCNKLDLVCRKLRLQPGERFLDIGCGWGALVCWAARHYGVRAHGITLSQQQLDVARARVAREGLGDLVSIELRDYRDLPAEAAYDRIASIGMFEHVGLANLSTYNAAALRLLRPGGLFLNHGITRDEEGWKKSEETEFINRYVFPDAEIDTIGNIQRGMEQAGFEIHDVEGLRPHYAMTLRRWVARLEAAHAQAADLVGEARYRVWRLYMAACALQFEEGATGIYQVLASRRGTATFPVPLSRRDIYR